MKNILWAALLATSLSTASASAWENINTQVEKILSSYPWYTAAVDIEKNVWHANSLGYSIRFHVARLLTQAWLYSAWDTEYCKEGEFDEDSGEKNTCYIWRAEQTKRLAKALEDPKAQEVLRNAEATIVKSKKWGFDYPILRKKDSN